MSEVDMIYRIITFLLTCSLVNSLTCGEVLQFPTTKKITLGELQTIQPKEMVQCLPHLSKEKFLNSEADFIWKSIVNYYNGSANVPDIVLMSLRWVTPALKPVDYENLTLSNIDVIQNFGLNYNLEEEQLLAIADRARVDFAGKEPEDYTYYDLTALRQILCAFNRSEIERIRPSAYREAALIIGKLEKCNKEPMEGFATLAVHPSAFGQPEKWSKATVKIVGNVAEYLDNKKTVEKPMV